MVCLATQMFLNCKLLLNEQNIYARQPEIYYSSKLNQNACKAQRQLGQTGTNCGSRIPLPFMRNEDKFPNWPRDFETWWGGVAKVSSPTPWEPVWFTMKVVGQIDSNTRTYTTRAQEFERRWTVVYCQIFCYLEEGQVIVAKVLICAVHTCTLIFIRRHVNSSWRHVLGNIDKETVRQF